MASSLKSQPESGRAFSRPTRRHPRRYETTAARDTHSTIRALCVRREWVRRRCCARSVRAIGTERFVAGIEPRFVPGAELARRLSGGSWWSGYRYVLEDSTGHEHARIRYNWRGPKSCATNTDEYPIRFPFASSSVAILDSAGDAVVAELTGGRHDGTITAGEHALRFVVTGAEPRGLRGPRRLDATMVVVDTENRSVMTLSWRKGRSLFKPSSLGRATLGETNLSDDEVLFVTCLAFVALAAAVSGGGG